AEEGLGPREATIKAMGEITGAIIGITLVLTAVFIPMALAGGSVGVIYRQFSITIVSAMALSVMVALTLTPVLCATLLKPHASGHVQQGKFFTWFNRTFDRSATRYQGGVGGLLKRGKRGLLMYAL
ncbi:efflux RND transporter permease subunit, partial [Acinetobacter baumannii]